MDTDSHFRIGMGLMMGLAFLVNMLWFGCKYVLRKRGYEVSFWSHGDVFPKMHQLIREETDPGLKKKYQGILYCLYGGFGFFILGMFMLWAVRE